MCIRNLDKVLDDQVNDWAAPQRMLLTLKVIKSDKKSDQKSSV